MTYTSVSLRCLLLRIFVLIIFQNILKIIGVESINQSILPKVSIDDGLLTQDNACMFLPEFVALKPVELADCIMFTNDGKVCYPLKSTVVIPY